MSTRAVSAGRWLTPLAILIAIAATPIVAVWGPLVLFGLLALVPGTQGVCET